MNRIQYTSRWMEIDNIFRDKLCRLSYRYPLRPTLEGASEPERFGIRPQAFGCPAAKRKTVMNEYFTCSCISSLAGGYRWFHFNK